MTMEQRMDQLEKRNKRLTVALTMTANKRLTAALTVMAVILATGCRSKVLGIRWTSEHFGWQLGIFTRWQLPGTGGI